MAIFYILLLFIIIAAVVAVETKDLLSSVICIGAVGFGASIMFLFLQAPDIAITQIVVEVLGLIILIRACLSRELTFISGPREFFGVVVSVVIIFVIFLAGIRILETKSAEDIRQIQESQPEFVTLPDFGTPIFGVAPDAASKAYVNRGMRQTGAANLVSSVILDFRAYDTLGEATVLFTAIIGATVVLRKKAKKLLEDVD